MSNSAEIHTHDDELACEIGQRSGHSAATGTEVMARHRLVEDDEAARIEAGDQLLTVVLQVALDLVELPALASVADAPCRPATAGTPTRRSTAAPGQD